MAHFYLLFSCICQLFLAALSSGNEFHISAKYKNGDLVLICTGSPKLPIHVMITPLHNTWMIFAGKQFNIEGILQYKSPTIQVLEYKENRKRLFYTIQVHVMESYKGDTKNISWTSNAFPLSEMYEIIHTYDGLQRPILRANEGNISINDPSKYAYPSSTFYFGNISFKIKNITTRDARYYTGCTVKNETGCPVKNETRCTVKNESWCGGGVVLVVKGNPTKPVITGNLTLKTGENASVTCHSKSTSVPSYYKEFSPLSYIWYINNTLVRETTGNTYRFTITKGDKHSYISCQAKETLISEKSKRLQIIPLYGPDVEDMKISPLISDNINLRDGDIFGPYLCLADCNPPCSIHWKYMEPSGKFVHVTTEGKYSKLLPKQRVQTGKHRLFQCVAQGLDGKLETITINLDIQYLSTPNVFINGIAASNVSNIPEYEPLQLSCLVEGNPAPSVTISRDRANHILVNSLGYWSNYNLLKKPSVPIQTPIGVKERQKKSKASLQHLLSILFVNLGLTNV